MLLIYLCCTRWQISYNFSLSFDKIPQDLLPLAAYFKEIRQWSSEARDGHSHFFRVFRAASVYRKWQLDNGIAGKTKTTVVYCGNLRFPKEGRFTRSVVNPNHPGPCVCKYDTNIGAYL